MSSKENLDIIALVQNNPLTRFSSSDCESSIVKKLVGKFTSEEQQYFIANFYVYLNYDTHKDFIISLNDVWKWLGYSRMDPCKVVLIKNFIENVDYKIERAAFAPEISGAKKNVASDMIEYQKENIIQK